MVMVWIQNRKHFSGTIFWVANFTIQTIALALIALRGTVPDWLSMVLSNTLVIAGNILGLIGLEYFAGIRKKHIFNWILLAIFAFIHFWFSIINPDLPIRNLNLASTFLIIGLQVFWLVAFRLKGEMKRLTLSIGIIFMLYCLVNTGRIVNFFTAKHPGNDYFEPNGFESSVLVFYQMLFILLTYALVMMFNKRLRLKISKQEERYSKAFNSSPYAILISRLTDGEILEINDGFSNITGYSYSEAIGKTTKELGIWVNEGDRMSVVNKLLTKEKVHELEFSFRIKSGDIITGLITSEIMTLNDEKTIFSSINDISAKKKTEESLKESQAMLQAAMDCSPSGIAIADAPDGMIRYVNKAGLMIPAKTEEEIVKDIDINKYVSSWNVKHHDGTPFKPDEVPLARAVLYGETNSREFIISRDNNEDRVVLANAAPIFDESGIVKAGIVVFQDMTDYKNAEEKLRQQFFTLKGLTDSSQSPIFSVDVNFCYTSYNKAHSAVMKHIYNSEIEIGMNLLDCMTNPDDIQKAKKNISLALNGQQITEESFSGDEDLSRVYFEVTHNPILNDDNAVIGVAVLVRDLTQPKRLELELHKKISELEKFNKIMVGREIRMAELKQEINELCTKLKQPVKYKAPDEIKKGTKVR
jgi:PAS domain S-box-containing protein